MKMLILHGKSPHLYRSFIYSCINYTPTPVANNDIASIIYAIKKGEELTRRLIITCLYFIFSTYHL